MSDDQRPEETPETPVPATPTEVPASPPKASATEGTPDPKSQTPLAGTPSLSPASPPKALATKGPPIDYAMPAQKSFIPSPALIRNVGCLIKLIFGFTVMLGLGYFTLVAMNPKARQWATKGAKDGSGGPTPFKAINQILAIPAQAMGKTNDVVKANNARVGQLDGLIAEEEARAAGGKGGRTSRPVVDPFAKPAPAGTNDPARAAGAAEVSAGPPRAVSSAAILALAEKRAATIAPAPPEAPAKPPEAKASPPGASAKGGDAPDEMKLPGDIVIAQASPAGSPRAGAAFFFWVVKLNVSGITQSRPARALLNGRLTYEGDEVNRPLGIVFAQLDPANKLLIFRDQTGAIVTRSY